MDSILGSRWGYTRAEESTALAAELEALGVDLVVLDQSLDTSTPTGRLIFHALAALAQFERDLIVERTRDGLAAARRRGQKLGRPPATDRRAQNLGGQAERLLPRGDH